MLRASVSDPAGPTWWRAATTLGALVPAVVALPFSLAAATSFAASAFAWMFVAGALQPNLLPRDAEVVIERGAIRIRSAGVVSQRIAAVDVVAGGTAHVDGEVIVALARGWPGSRPLVLRVSSEREAHEIRRALGIGDRGFGRLRWPDGRGHGWFALLLRLAAAVGWLAVATAAPLGPVDLTLGLLFPMTLFSVVVLAWIASGGTGRAGATTAERTYALALEGQGVREERTTSVAPLTRSSTEGTRAWLQRIDAMAASMGESDGYRSAGVDRSDLWDALEDPDAPPALRAGAARMLARVAPDEAPRRIADALAVERDGAARAHIRIALEEDVETAARGLERLSR